MAEGEKAPFVVNLGSRNIYKKGKICPNSCIKNDPLFDQTLADIDYLQCLLGADNSLNRFPNNIEVYWRDETPSYLVGCYFTPSWGRGFSRRSCL